MKIAFKGIELSSLKEISDKYYSQLISYIFESIEIYTSKNFDTSKIEYKNLQLINDALKDNHVFLFSAHHGNWEWASIILPTFIKNDVYGIYKPLSNETMDILVREFRGKYGLKLVPMNDVSKVIGQSKHPSIFIFIADQSPPSPNSGKWINFFNKDTVFYNGAEILMKRYKAKAIYQHCIFKDNKYKIHFQELNQNEPTEHYAALLENDIKVQPELWLWSHKRWKHSLSNG